MLSELAVRDLGVIADLELVLGDGLTVVTGETGAGKTLIVDAISLLAGGRADSSAVRDGASEAAVEGRFVTGDEEVVVRRVIPARGRSRAYIDGQMATAATLSDLLARHVDLHTQHAHQSLLSVTGQRAALDRFAGVDLAPLLQARGEVRRLTAELDGLGGDPAARERESDLLRFQLAELADAAIVDADEDDRLAAEEAMLGDVAAHRARAATALDHLVGDYGATDALGAAIGELAGDGVLVSDHTRLVALAAELDDAVRELRMRAESIVEDPERLAEIAQRRQVLAALRRRHGDGTLAGLITEQKRLGERLAELDNAEERARVLGGEIEAARELVAAEAAVVGAARRAAAADFASAVQAELVELAMPAARFEVRVPDIDPGDEVQMLFSANPGMALQPLARVASGGELARTMLALRLIATADQDTVVFDEVDAGIGGAAALAVGAALARLAADRQVLVVTHLAQVAAAADEQIGVSKIVEDATTRTGAVPLTGDTRVVELSRMLSGQPSSDSARAHARELLDTMGEVVRGG